MHRKELVYISNIIWVEESALEPRNSFHCSSNQKMQIQQAIGFLRLIDPVNLTLLQQQKAACLEGPKSQMVTTCWPSKLKFSAEDMGHGWASVFNLLKQLSVQFGCSVVFNSLPSHGLQHARPPCPSPTPGVYPNSCPLSWWCHPTIFILCHPFSSCPQSFPASGPFQMSQFFASGSQNIGVSASTSVLPMNTQG